jgi:iron complex transport system substrate-binding protein
MRICSLLPSATEMIAQLGLIDSLVGVSDECKWPSDVVGKPVVTAARIDPAKLSSLEIDEAVRASLRDGASLYTVDAELIDALAPDLIVTQDLCAVCAVSSGAFTDACPAGTTMLSLDPRTLREVAESVRVLARALDSVERGEQIVTEMWHTIDTAAESV